MTTVQPNGSTFPNLPCPRANCQSLDTLLIEALPEQPAGIRYERWTCQACGKPFVGDRNIADSSFTYLGTYFT
jgi:hypothetical protein